MTIKLTLTCVLVSKWKIICCALYYLPRVFFYLCLCLFLDSLIETWANVTWIDLLKYHVKHPCKLRHSFCLREYRFWLLKHYNYMWKKRFYKDLTLMLFSILKGCASCHFISLTHIFSALWKTLSQSTTSSCCRCVSSPIEFCSNQTFDQKLLQNAVAECISAWVAGQQMIFMYLISLGFHCSQ